MSTVQLPASLLSVLRSCEGFHEADFLAAHASAAALTSVRVNPFKVSSLFENEEKVPWCREGYYLQERPFFIAEPLFHAGCYYVQEASSMFLDYALRHCIDVKERLKVLDLCAAPGGKSTLLNSLLHQESLLVANEVIKTRVPVLAENLSKWGSSNTFVTNNDPRDFSALSGFFDVLVADAPCSGSGLFRKQPGAVQEWSENNVQLCCHRQQRILADALPALKQNGILIYSTCSYSPEENEAICDWLCAAAGLESIAIDYPQLWGITATQSPQHKAWGYRFYPDKVKGEGFFLACFRKNEAQAAPRIKRSSLPSPTKQELHLLHPWTGTGEEHRILKQAEDFHLVPAALAEDWDILSKFLYIKKSGINLGQLKGKDMVPHHQLALSTLPLPYIRRIAVNRETAIAFLRKQEVQLQESEKGFCLLTYEGFGIGWVKVLPNRVNNYFPKEWRILSDIEA